MKIKGEGHEPTFVDSAADHVIVVRVRDIGSRDQIRRPLRRSLQREVGLRQYQLMRRRDRRSILRYFWLQRLRRSRSDQPDKWKAKRESHVDPS